MPAPRWSRALSPRKLACRAVLAGSCLTFLSGVAPTPDFRLQLVADVPLGGNATRLDYASLDPDRHLLFIAHLGEANAHVVTVDPKTHRIFFPLKNVGGRTVLRIMSPGAASAP